MTSVTSGYSLLHGTSQLPKTTHGPTSICAFLSRNESRKQLLGIRPGRVVKMESLMYYPHILYSFPNEPKECGHCYWKLPLLLNTHRRLRKIASHIFADASWSATQEGLTRKRFVLQDGRFPNIAHFSTWASTGHLGIT